MSDKTSKPILLLDFDGVVHSYTSGWQGATNIPDRPTEGFWEWAEAASQHFDLQIYSSRSSQPGGIEAMAAWLVDNRPRNRAREVSFAFPTTKPAAFLTIDDRCLRFTGSWRDLPIHMLLEFRPWNREQD